LCRRALTRRGEKDAWIFLVDSGVHRSTKLGIPKAPVRPEHDLVEARVHGLARIPKIRDGSAADETGVRSRRLIASVRLGAGRVVSLRTQTGTLRGEHSATLRLRQGSLLLMSGVTQEDRQHGCRVLADAA